MLKIKQLQDLIHNTDWTLNSTPKLYRVSKEYTFRDQQTGKSTTSRRETIVQTLDLRYLENFSNALSLVVGKKLVPQFPHLTLFTKGTDVSSKMGIGIDSLEDFEKLDPQPIADYYERK